MKYDVFMGSYMHEEHVCYVEHLDCTFYIKYNISAKFDDELNAESYHVTTDMGVEFSFNAYPDDTPTYVLELAETLIKDEWYSENV